MKKILAIISDFTKRCGVYLCVVSFIFYTQINWLRQAGKGIYDLEVRLFLGFLVGITLAYSLNLLFEKFIFFNDKVALSNMSAVFSPGALFIFCSRYPQFFYIIPALSLLAFILIYKKYSILGKLNKFLGMIAYILTFLSGIGILYSAFCAFSAGRFSLVDYGKYTNMLWNSAHGHFFRELMDYSYLGTHLSFTLLLLSPLFYIWDHPFLLSFTQWILAMCGFMVLGWIAKRENVNGTLIGSFLLVSILNPFTQQVLLCEFHGTSLYFILIPIIYYFLLYNKNMVFIPIILLYGVREDSAFVIFPMLLYFSIKDRWKMGYFWAALSVFYGLFASFVFFKWINNYSILKRRSSLKIWYLKNCFFNGSYFSRLKHYLWLYIPIFPFLVKSWIPLLVFPSAGILMAFLSPYPPQWSLRYHYPAPIIVCLIVGLLHALIQSTKNGFFNSKIKITLFSLLLITSAIVSHHVRGFIPGGHMKKYYTKIDHKGIKILKASQQIPKRGILVCSSKLAAFCANRLNLITWNQFYHHRHNPDIIFFEITKLNSFQRKTIHKILKERIFGVKYNDGSCAILVKGYSSQMNDDILKLLDHKR